MKLNKFKNEVDNKEVTVNEETNYISEETNNISEETEEIKDPSIYGEVIAEGKLNIRKRPDKNSDILTVVNRSEKLLIKDKSDDIFYRVVTPSGIEGFAMKEFVKIK